MMQSCEHLTENQKKQYAEESKWTGNSPADSDSPEMFSFLCSVQCKNPNSEAEKLIAVRYEKLKLDLPTTNSRFQKRHTNNTGNYFLSGGLLYYTHPNYAVVLCVPNIYDADGVNHRKRVFDELHSSEYSGHRGENTTVAVITRRFWWNDVTKEVRQMCKACFECNTSKINRKKPQGLLQPIGIPLFPAQSYIIRT